jgi:sugar/nucleoside kinase (ribokinase family)
MKEMMDVYIVGDYCLDLVLTGMKSAPIMGKEIIASNINMTLGGACNSALAMHRLGLKVAWAADFGNDQFSEFVIKKMKDEKFDSRFFIQHNKHLRFLTVSLSYPTDRAFVAYYDKSPIKPAALSFLRKVKAKWIYIPGLLFGPLFEARRILIINKKQKIAMDGNYKNCISLKNKAVCKAIEKCNLFFANAQEARCLTGENNLEKALKVLKKICSVVIIKAGKLGAYGADENSIEFVPAIRIHTLDTTGAGDCFNAGFMKAWIEGLNLRESLKWGNIVGGLSTTELGGVARSTKVSDVLHWIKKYKD